jgi:hypothetical protein
MIALYFVLMVNGAPVYHQTAIYHSQLVQSCTRQAAENMKITNGTIWVCKPVESKK